MATPAPSKENNFYPTFEVDFKALHGGTRQRVFDRFDLDKPAAKSIVLVHGGGDDMKYDTDGEKVFRQESTFHYLFGVREPGCYGTLELDEKRAVLFVPRLPKEYAVWMGEIHGLEWFQNRYKVDEVKYVDELQAYFESYQPSSVFLNKGINSDSGAEAVPAHFDGLDKYKCDFERFHDEVYEARVIKTPEELEIMRYVTKISSDAHIRVLKYCQPGMREYQLESLFLHDCYTTGGCRHAAYTSICGSGNNAATLHYGHAGAPNDKLIEDGDIMLCDMGAEYHCYTSDITVSYPANGKFTEKQKGIYNAVYEAQKAVGEAMRPGVMWKDMHLLANRVICEHLLKLGLLKGSIDELMENYIGAVFMPHGLGHFIGCDTHDVGGYPRHGCCRLTEPGVKSLRTLRELKENMCLTNEPGLYFIDALLDGAKADPSKSKFFNWEKVDEYRGFGGVRLEDDVIVTKDGIENMTKVPRTWQEVEQCMSQK